MNKTYVIDGSNVCWWYSQTHQGEASIQPLLTVLIALLEHGDNFYCVFDANVMHVLGGDNNDLITKAIGNLLETYPSKFYRVTGATRADGVVLHDADHHGRDIITNDIYRDYKDKYAWLNQYTTRLIQGNLQPSGLMTLDKLPYGRLSLLTDTENALRRLFDQLDGRIKPEIATTLDDCNIDNLTHRFIKNPVYSRPDQIVNENLSEKVSGGVNQKAESKIDPEQQCIDNAQEALKAFYANQIYNEYAPGNRDRYFMNYGRKEIIKFEGASWDVAVKRLGVLFDSNKVCTYCYHIQPFNNIIDLSEGACVHCKKDSLTEIPEAIWEIIDRYAPSGNKIVREIIKEKKERQRKIIEEEKEREMYASFEGAPPVAALAAAAALAVAKIVDKIRGK